jgi:hypothetical protein
MRVTKKPSLAETHPELAAQAHGWDPEVVSYTSGKYFDWQCKFGHIWYALMSNRAKGSGCPFCANKAVLPGYNDLTVEQLCAYGPFANDKCRSAYMWGSELNKPQVGIEPLVNKGMSYNARLALCAKMHLLVGQEILI